MRGALKYAGPTGECWLMPGSLAHKLAAEGKRAELEKHMLDVQQRYDRLLGNERKVQKNA